MKPEFHERYGPWAVIAGASEGIGAAFAHALAARGMSLVLVARREEPLAKLAETLAVPSRIVVADLASGGTKKVFEATSELDVGLVVANAALSPIGPFTTVEPDVLRRALELNCGAALDLARHYTPAMVARGRGGLILMSSLAGQQGSPGIAVYAATKAFDAILAEGLWAELRPHGVDVLSCVPGAVETPGLAANSSGRAPGTVTADVVARAALKALGRKPRVVPGAMMSLSSALMTHLLPKRTAITIIARASKDVLAQ
ncbi:MAG TPA: SDR family NAD(P)-dependent oxidoreductase [Candidatus Limnocylindrales bacterium]|nr:SDR family NAD(P)-dependent oxidoreductase [Candidatus Limnocylindrales bacterium]